VGDVNAGRRLQVLWRWNGRPLRVRITRADGTSEGWCITWQRRRLRGDTCEWVWEHWRAYRGGGTLAEVIADYRGYAAGWRGLED
jgi:hypothetical protein